jgi:SAM-dependent methyltransferase
VIRDTAVNRFCSPALEVGCGDGYLLSLLPGPVRVGVDLTFEDLVEAKNRNNAVLVRASASRLPFRIRFPLVCAFDVVEHIDDDVEFLRSCASVLAAEGRLVIATPSGPELWSFFDVYAGHRRRYTKDNLRRVLEEAGLKVEVMFPLFRLLVPLAWLNARFLGKKTVTKPASDFSVGPMANWLLHRLLAMERIIFGRSPWGRGTSWVVVARIG